MKKVNNKCIFMLGIILGLVISVSSVYAVEAYIESNKVSYDNSKSNGSYKEVQSSIDELYERSGIHKEKWIDKTLNGADPVLKDPLIPVEIKSNGDVYYANLNSEWYNYSEKRWANAVILTDTASQYSVGDHILEKDIESYFVWIPRYQYRIWDMGKYTSAPYGNTLTNNGNYQTSLIQAVNKSRIIEIKFGSVEKTPKMSESSAKLNEYYTHPAFTLGEKDLNGIWIGKFETGYKGANSKESAEVNKEEPTSIIIKPDVYSWRSITAKKIFMTAYNYKNIENKHNENLDPHMLKNTEWGAAAYLSHSQYGIGTEVRMNNSSQLITGKAVALNTNLDLCGDASSDITQSYNSDAGFLASTTGNITGVYDMSGGSSDYVAACIDGNVGDSEFSITELKLYMDLGYIDKYNTNSTTTTFNNRILGDATGELGAFYNYCTACCCYSRGWHSDFAYFVFSTSPWFHRGGGPAQGILAGQFYFGSVPGGAYVGNGFRIALAIK